MRCYLEHRDLIRCRKVSSAFKQVIDGTPLLQYIVEFGAAGYTVQRSTAADMLKQHHTFRSIQRAWRDPQPRCIHSEHLILTNSLAWNVGTAVAFGGILLGTVRGDHSGELLHTLKLEPGPNSHRTLRFNHRVLRFLADGEQDLLVLVSWTMMRFISLSKSPKPHKRAGKGFVNIDSYMAGLNLDDIRNAVVSGDWVLLTTVRKGRDSFMLCHWPSGEMLTKRSQADVLNHDAHLVNGYLLICQSVMDPIFCRVVNTLEVYSPKIGSRTTNRLQLHPLARLELPQTTLLSPNAKHPALRRIPSSSSPGLVCVSLDGESTREWDLYVPLHTVLLNSAKHAGASYFVPWNAWGLFSRQMTTRQQPCAIVGLRVIFQDTICDFNPVDVTRNIYAPVDTASGLVCFGPTIVPENANRKWSIASHPYRQTTLRLPDVPPGVWFQQSIFQDAVSGPKIVRVFFQEQHPLKLEIISL